MQVVTEFHASALSPVELNRIAEEYLALEHFRVFRRLLVRRFGLLSLAAIIAGLAFHWLSAAVTASCVAMFLVPPVWIWLVEVRHDRAFARRLERIPGVITLPASEHAASPLPEPMQKVVKSS